MHTQGPVTADVDPQPDGQNSTGHRARTPVHELTRNPATLSLPPPELNSRPRRATRLNVDYRVPTEDDLPSPERTPRRILPIPHARSRYGWVDGQDRERTPTPPPVYRRRSIWAGADAPPISPPSRIRQADWVRRANTPPIPLDTAILGALRRIRPSGPLNRTILEEEVRHIRIEAEAADAGDAGYLWECTERFLRYCEQHHWP